MSTANQFLDVAWILVCAALVMLMQAGFSCLESGLVRTKNSINVAAKNFADFCLASAVFWLFGFALMFGASSGGIFGTSGFLFDDTANPWLMAFFIFQLGFCGTAVTIVSGAVSERMRFAGYLVIATIVSAVIYPFIGHWVWGSASGVSSGGWLEQRGFIDFAGCTVVHSVGGWIALAAIIIIGPRIGRFGKNAVPIHGHDLPFVTLGVFLLWFGWFGFNGGSTLGLTPEVPVIIVNTTVSGAFGGLVAMALAWRLGGQPDVAMIMNGSLAGLVGITASAHIMTPVAAAGIGSIAAVIMYAVAMLLEKLEIDDVVGAVPVHLAAGIWGTLAVAIFGNPEAWGTGLGRWDQLVVQATGVAATFVWAFGLGFALLWLINRVYPLRIDPEGEQVGLNVAEHGASTEILDLLTEMDAQRRANDFSQPVNVEPHTEIGQIAQQYNRVIADINAEQRRREAATEALRQKTISLELLQGAAVAANQAKTIEDAIQTCLEGICEFGGWAVGHCYMLDDASGELVSAKIWHFDDTERFARFREVTEATTFKSGVGLPGRVMASRNADWILDVSVDPNFLRTQNSEDLGVKGAAAFPVLVEEDVVAVLEFFSVEPVESNEAMLEVMVSVGTQLGRVVERRRSESARFKSVVDNMPANVHLRDKKGCFILINRKYEEFYGITNDSARGKTLDEVNMDEDFDI
ncbi:MAG: ammonium transporter, partial [Planctomycetota bacterium]